MNAVSDVNLLYDVSISRNATIADSCQVCQNQVCQWTIEPENGILEWSTGEALYTCICCQNIMAKKCMYMCTAFFRSVDQMELELGCPSM